MSRERLPHDHPCKHSEVPKAGDSWALLLAGPAQGRSHPTPDSRLPEPVRALKGARSLPERVSHTPWDTGLSGSGQSSSVEGGALGDPVTGVRVVGELNEHACVLSGFSRVWLFVTPWTVAHQAPLSMGFSKQDYWSGLACPPPGGLPDPGIEPTSLMSPAEQHYLLKEYPTPPQQAERHRGLRVHRLCKPALNLSAISQERWPRIWGHLLLISNLETWPKTSVF